MRYNNLGNSHRGTIQKVLLPAFALRSDSLGR